MDRSAAIVKQPDGATTFRRWLVEKLKQSRWARSREDTVETMAVRIGVQPDLLEQAQRELDEEQRRQGRRKVHIGQPYQPRVSRRKVEVQLPRRVHEDWVAYCGHRGLRPAVVLRSLVHRLLSGPQQPSWLGRDCFYRGKTYSLEGYKRGQKWPYLAKTDVTQGANRALTRRAMVTGTTVAGLLRGVVLDLLEGRTRHLTVITSTNSMFDDENRYWTLENDNGSRRA